MQTRSNGLINIGKLMLQASAKHTMVVGRVAQTWLVELQDIFLKIDLLISIIDIEEDDGSENEEMIK